MSSTLVGIDEDLHLANVAVADLQASVIAAYEANDVVLARALDQQLTDAISKRDSLSETKAYIVDKERAQDCSGRLSSVLYLSQMADSLSVQDIPSLVFHANGKNELVGVTGVLYVLRGWFASYLEGSADVLDRLLRRLKQDARHTRFRIVSRTTDVPNAVRRYPNNGLLLKRLETPQTVSQQNPEATMLCELSTHLKLQSFVPVLSSVTRGRLADDASLVGRAATLKRFLALVRPLRSGPFYGPSTSVQGKAEMLATVMEAVRHTVEQTNNSMCQGAVIGPHSSDGVVLCFQSEHPAEVIRRLTKLFSDLNGNAATEAYCPVVALHYSESVESVMDGHITFVGPPLRLLRLHSELAFQFHKGMVVTEDVAVLLHGEGCVSFHTTEFVPRRPVDVYVPEALAAFDWQVELKRRAMERAAAADALLAGSTDGVDQSLPSPLRGGASFRKAQKRAVAPTSEDANRKPVKGFTDEAAMRALFDALPVSSNGMLERSHFDAWLHTQENAGVPVYNAEVDRVLQQYDAAGSDYVTFDQFCLVAYQRMK